MKIFIFSKFFSKPDGNKPLVNIYHQVEATEGTSTTAGVMKTKLIKYCNGRTDMVHPILSRWIEQTKCWDYFNIYCL